MWMKFLWVMKAHVFQIIIFSISLFLLCVCAQSFSHVWPFLWPRDSVAHQALFSLWNSFLSQTRALELVVSFLLQRISSWPRDPALVSCNLLHWFFTIAPHGKAYFYLALFWLAMSFSFDPANFVLIINEKVAYLQTSVESLGVFPHFLLMILHLLTTSMQLFAQVKVSHSA